MKTNKLKILYENRILSILYNNRIKISIRKIQIINVKHFVLKIDKMINILIKFCVCLLINYIKILARQFNATLRFFVFMDSLFYASL